MGRIFSIVDHAPPVDTEPFFARQFWPGRTRAQLVFDVVFGIAGPILCFIADPIVFKSGAISFTGAAILGRYQLFAYLLSAIAIGVLVAWFCLDRNLDSFRPVISGVFVAGAAFSTLIGVIILPFSLMGLLFIIGLAGFTPFLTAFVYLRNGFRAFPGRMNGGNRELRWPIAVVSGFVAISLATVVSYQVSSAISRSVQEVLQGDSDRAEAAAAQIKWIPFVPKESLDEIVRTYEQEPDNKKKAVLRNFYEDLTGQDIDQRLRILND